MKRPKQLAVLVATTVLATASVGSRAQALGVVNDDPGFAADLSAWRTVYSPFAAGAAGTLSWSPVDLDGEVGSGSVSIVGPPGIYILYACLPADFLWTSRSFRLEADSGSFGTHSRLFGTVTFGFAGDAGETDGCVGPGTSYFEAIDAWLDEPGVTRHVSPSLYVSRPGPLVTFGIQLYKFDDGAVFIDNVRLLADGEIPFSSNFE